MSDLWPDADVTWEYPRDSRDNRNRWRDAIGQAVEAGTLRLEGDGDSKETGQYELTGRCPRCDHLMDQSIEFGVVRDDRPPPVPGEPPGGWFNIVCNCDRPHDDRRPPDTHGCGWALAISVKLVRP